MRRNRGDLAEAYADDHRRQPLGDPFEVGVRAQETDCRRALRHLGRCLSGVSHRQDTRHREKEAERRTGGRRGTEDDAPETDGARHPGELRKDQENQRESGPDNPHQREECGVLISLPGLAIGDPPPDQCAKHSDHPLVALVE